MSHLIQETEDTKKTANINEKFLKNIMISLPQYFFWKDVNSVYLGCNKNYADLLGLDSPEEIVGKKHEDFACQLSEQGASTLHQGDQQTLLGYPVTNQEAILRLPHNKMMVTMISKLPIRDEGKVIGIIGYFSDITGLKDKEQALIQAKEQAELTLNNIVANMPGHVYWKDKNGIYLGCNNRQAHSLGLNYGSEVIGKTDFDLPWPKDVARAFRKNDIRIIQTGNTEIIEEDSQINGKKAIVLSQKTPLKDKEGKCVGVLGISIDITERKKFEIDLKEAKEKAETANKAKTEFLENMRHDIRTPLMGITGFANIICDEVKDAKIKGYVDSLSTSSYALLDLLNEILDIVKLNSGEIPLMKKKFVMKKRLNDVIKLYQAKAHHKNLELTLDYDDQIPRYLLGDSTRIHRIVLELIANALNFTERGSVRLAAKLVKIENADAILKIIIEDTGIGMALEKQQEIFLQFKRLTPSYEGIYKGVGLGLAIVKQFIEDLRGEIYVESKIGFGTKFTCIIPLKKSLLDDDIGIETDTDTFEHHRMINSSATTHKNMLENMQLNAANSSKILVVEDNNIAAAVVNTMLSKLACQVTIAENGQQALQLIQHNHYDLIFMDIGLPDLNGYEVTRRIRLQELNKGIHTPIVALTAHVDVENKKRCLTVGMNAIYTKPLTQDKTENILNAFIPHRKQNSDARKMSFDKKGQESPIKQDIVDHDFIKKQLGDNQGMISNLFNLLAHDLQDELQQLELAYKKADWQAIQAIAHKLKGGASYIGAARLLEACLLLEQSIEKQEANTFDSLYNKLLNEVAAVRQVMTAHI